MSDAAGAGVGLIVNAAAGRDIRRLVGAASVMTNHEKSAIVRRVVCGLEAAGVDRVRYLDDGSGGEVAGAGTGTQLRTSDGGYAQVMYHANKGKTGVGASYGFSRLKANNTAVGAGGDGTNRAVASACGEVPLVAISTGTNNVFPSMVEGTVAGLAAGMVAGGAMDLDLVAPRAKWVEVDCGGIRDVALIDVAACRDAFRGTAAIWDPGRVTALVLSRAEPWAVGLSSIGGRLLPVTPVELVGLHLELGEGGRMVTAVIAPGLIRRVPVRACRLLRMGEPVVLDVGDGIVALDGERELPAHGEVEVRVTAGGPRLVDVRRVLELSALAEVDAAVGAERG